MGAGTSAQGGGPWCQFPLPQWRTGCPAASCNGITYRWVEVYGGTVESPCGMPGFWCCHGIGHAYWSAAAALPRAYSMNGLTCPSRLRDATRCWVMPNVEFVGRTSLRLINR